MSNWHTHPCAYLASHTEEVKLERERNTSSFLGKKACSLPCQTELPSWHFSPDIIILLLSFSDCETRILPRPCLPCQQQNSSEVRDADSDLFSPPPQSSYKSPHTHLDRGIRSAPLTQSLHVQETALPRVREGTSTLTLAPFLTALLSVHR